ncbi:MAG TPA: NrfD/PsrC family molybdoenzyme membrane anchor subunit [Gemmatimonadaceae bacterium]|nr:NrfD/PsrC family molybdoenzyme membrane anchor subunit [Gemmatimonadaceae bacterium]
MIAPLLALPALLLQLAANPQSGVALPPHWGWYIILYFFLGGLAAGSFFIATMLELVGDPRDEEAIRLGYLVAFPLVVVCLILLVLDLGKPLRFWHMLIQSERVPLPILKAWSPISVGSWVLSAFAFFAFVAFVGVLVETGRVRSAPLVRLDRWARSRPRPFSILWGIAGAFFGFFLAGYTGVLVTGTSIPFWHNARLMGGLFLVSAASTSYALLILLLVRRNRGAAGTATVAKLERADRLAIALELIILAIMLLLLGGVARPMIAGGFGVVFWLGVVLLGLVAPLVLHWRGRGAHHAAAAGAAGWHGDAIARRATLSAGCVLVGGLLLRFVVVMSAQWPRVPLWYL